MRVKFQQAENREEPEERERERERKIGTETLINLEGKTVERGKQRDRNGKTHT